MYDLQGHLVGEYTSAGVLIQETVWLNDLPIATLRPNGTGIAVYFVHPDELGTPRVVTDTTNKPVWRWDSDAFGRTLPNQDPLKTGKSFVYHLRYPGQYYDTQSGLHYNYFRDYDPQTGRYIQSDPIGLAGGWNTYSYVGGNPITKIDPLGLLDLIYDNNTKTLTITDKNGNTAGSFPAANNAQSGSRGPWKSGKYDYGYHTTHKNDAPDSPYGSNGNFIFNVPGCTGCGVHSGRANSTDRAGRSGEKYATNGCIRTTDEATGQIQKLIEFGDPLKTLTVTR